MDGGGRISKFCHNAIRLWRFYHGGAMASAMAMASWRSGGAMAVNRPRLWSADEPWTSTSTWVAEWVGVELGLVDGLIYSHCRARKQ